MTNKDKLEKDTGIQISDNFAHDAARKYHAFCWICPAYGECEVLSEKPTAEECEESLKKWLDAEVLRREDDE